MGKDLFDDFKDLVEEADDILGYSIRRLCLEDPDGQLNFTQYTQPALYVVNALSYYSLLRSGGATPDYVAGHSLGEYNALLAAEAFDFGTGLRLVKKRGELMGQAKGGGMAAVLGMPEKEIRELLRSSGFDAIDVANLNAPSQTVISGRREDIEKAEEVFTRNKSCRYAMLQVSGAFHSRYMADAEREFAGFLDQFEVRPPAIPVIANVTARPYRPTEVKDTLVAQISSAVKWSETVRYLMGKGVEEMTQVGPGRVLTSLVRTIKREAEPLVVPDSEEETDPVVPAPRPEAAQPEAAPQAATPQPEPQPEPQPQARPGAASGHGTITAADLGSASFKRDYGIRYACLIGGMYHGVASKELVVAAAREGMLAFLGTGGLSPDRVESDVRYLTQQLTAGEPFGADLLYDPASPEREERIVDIYLRHGVRTVEASAFITMTPALVRYRLTGLTRNADGHVVPANRIIAKVSRPEVATAFLSPAPARVVDKLLAEGKISAAEAELARELPVADDLCCEADSGGHTDQGVAFSLIPAMTRLRDDMMARHQYPRRIRLGAAGGIGTPAAVAASLVMGVDFVMTGSINQCTVEAGTSDLVKDLLAGINIQDTGYAPAGDLFEYGARVQVLKKGVLFPARANKLYELYKRHSSLDDIDAATAEQLQTRYFKRSFADVYAEVRASRPAADIEKAEKDPKHKMALVFRWYFDYATRQALSGADEGRVDFQVHCGPSLGAFNQWVKGTELEDWRNRRVADINRRVMTGAAELLQAKLDRVGTN